MLVTLAVGVVSEGWLRPLDWEKEKLGRKLPKDQQPGGPLQPESPG